MTIIIIIAIFAVVLILLLIFRRKSSRMSYSKLKSDDTKDSNLQQFTLTELANFDGKNNNLIYLACKGFVFDVTNSEHYKSDGSYSCFAGKDCSVALAKMSFDQVYLNCANDASLTQQEQTILDQWYNKFIEKYTVIGKVKY